MKACVLLVCVVLCLGIVPVQAQDSNPYIYYFDSFRNAFIVERADGTDTRVFGEEALATTRDIPTQLSGVSGPGWSPDGRWFAFARRGESRPDGFILRVDGTEYKLERGVVFTQVLDRADAIEYFWQVNEIHWSPDSRYVLVHGHPDPRPNWTETFYPNMAYWLIDLETNTSINQFNYRRMETGPVYTPVEWNMEQYSVSFFIVEDDLGRYYNRDLSPRITMYFDGTILREPSSGQILELDIPSYSLSEIIPSPSRRFRITGDNQLIDDQLQITIDLPQPDFGDRWEEFRPYYPLVAAWDATESWVIIGYSTYSNVVGGLAIVRSDGTGFRTLSAATCLEWNPGNACVGWLPDNVDVDSIPLLADAP